MRLQQLVAGLCAREAGDGAAVVASLDVAVGIGEQGVQDDGGVGQRGQQGGDGDGEGAHMGASLTNIPYTTKYTITLHNLSSVFWLCNGIFEH